MIVEVTGFYINHVHNHVDKLILGDKLRYSKMISKYCEILMFSKTTPKAKVN